MGRYDRQLLVFGDEGQERIGKAKVGIVGCGGLGTNVSTALGVAGIGHFVIMDSDVPEDTNLNRQYVFCRHVDSGEESRPKAELLAEWILGLYSKADVEYHVSRFGEDTWSVFDDCDILVDCLDSIEGRMILNRYAVEKGKPLVHGGVHAFIGEITVIIPGRTPCLKCMMGDIPEPERPLPSIGSVVTTIGSMEATEVLKLILDRSSRTEGTFLSIDFEDWRVTPVHFKTDPGCPVCRRFGLS